MLARRLASLRRHLSSSSSSAAASAAAFDYSDVAETFHRDGVALVPGFASGEECEEMMGRMAELIDAWDPVTIQSFRTDGDQVEDQGSSDYFLDSAGVGVALVFDLPPVFCCL